MSRLRYRKGAGREEETQAAAAESPSCPAPAAAAAEEEEGASSLSSCFDSASSESPLVEGAPLRRLVIVCTVSSPYTGKTGRLK
jgi:hypothetical protein